MKKILAGFLLLTVLFTQVSAQNLESSDNYLNEGITLSPPNYIGKHAPGDVITQTVTISNRTDQDLQIDPTKGEYLFSSVERELISEPNPLVSGNWMNAVNQFSLPKGKTAMIELVLRIPEAANDGSYGPVAIFSFSSVENSELAGSGASINTQIAFPFFVNVNDIPPSFSVQVAPIEVQSIYAFGDVSFTYKIQNLINNFITPIGYLQVLDTSNKAIYSEIINESLSPLDPTSEITGTIVLPINTADISSIGSYTIELLAVDSQYGNSHIEKASFQVAPLPIVAILGIVLIILFLIILALLSRGKNTPRRKSHK